MDDIFELIAKTMVIMLFSILLGIITLLLVFLYGEITGKNCLNNYENAKYSFFGGCKIEYNGKYIPEKLYIKAFEENINLTF